MSLAIERNIAGSVGVESGADTRPPMQPQSPYDSRGLQFAWDNTSLTWFIECPWKYKASMIDGWTPKRKSANLLFGGWYASALELFHRLLVDGVDREEALRRIVHATLVLTWEWDSDHNTKTRENLIRTIIWYVDHFDPDPLEVVILGDGRPAVEHTFALELTDNILWCGHWDRLVTYGGDVYVQDQKTTASTLTSHYFEQFDPDNQMTGYAFAAKALLGTPVRGVVIDAAQVAVGFSRFERGFTFRTDTKLEEWYHDTLYWIEQARHATESGYFPRNRSSCTKYGGCVFREVCSRSPEVRENYLHGDFEKRLQWNPLEAR